MAFRRSPVRSRSGPPSFAHECRRRMPRRSVATCRAIAPKARRRERRGGGPVLSLNELRLGEPREGCRAAKTSPSWASEHCRNCHTLERSPAIVSILRRRRRHFGCSCPSVPADKRFVYVLKNADPSLQFYVGLTSNVGARVSDHNDGRCPHTAMRRPWKLHVSIEFADEETALRFERYLKSGSGRAFAKRHFEP
jgi:putative endonuclease